jgi:hypothetical protein
VALLPGVDVRADGGLVVLPPSLHVTGNRYQWDPSTVEHGLAVMPAWLLTLITAAAPAEGGHARLDVRTVLQGVPEGERDVQLYRLAAKLRAADVPEEWAIRLVTETAVRCTPPFPEKDARAKVASAYGRYTPNGRASLSLSPKTNESEENRSAWLVTLAEVRRRFAGRRPWLVEGYIPRGGLTEVPGAPESLKSWAMVDLARAVLTGGRWLDQFDVPQGSVVYVEQERARNLDYQAELLEAGYACDLNGLHIIPPAGVDLLAPLWQARVRAAVELHQPLLVILNSFRAMYRGQPGSGTDMASALGWLGSLAEDSNAAIVIVDQTNKAGAAGYLRGQAAHADSLQKEFEADTVLHFERDRDPLGRGTGPARVYVGKMREGTAGPPFTFALVDQDQGGVRLLHQGETSIERSPAAPSAREKVRRALTDAVEPLSPPQLAAATGLRVGTVGNQLSVLKARGEAEQVSHGRWQVSSLSPGIGENED